VRCYEVDGASITLFDTGAPSADAPTVLLLHGFPLSSNMWHAQIDALRPHCRVVAPDLRGFGESTMGHWPTADQTPSLDRYADDLAELIGGLEPPRALTLVGFSMGGYIAFSMLRRHADTFDRLALLNTRAADDSAEARATRLKMADHVHEWGAARIAELMRPNLFAAGTPASVVDPVVRDIAATAPAAIAAAQRAMAARPASTPLLASIDKPTLVVVGEQDAISPPAEMRAMADAIRGARFVEVAGVGHMAPVENAAAVSAALLEFASAR